MSSHAPGRKYSKSPFLLLALLALGAKAGATETAPVPAGASSENAPQEAPPQLTLQPTAAKPGDPVLVRVSGVTAPPTGTLAGRALRFFPWGDGYLAVSGLPVELTPGAAEVTAMGPVIPGAPRVELKGTLDIVESGYPSRELRVAGKYVKPPASVRRRMAADRRAFAAAFAQDFSAPHFSRNFAWPREDRITAPFGDRRTFNGKLSSQHFGVDIDGDPGTPVQAANDGTVVMARDNYAAGNTVLVHHGAGLYTAYFHLSRIDVKTGARVKQGQVLGKVGSTGRVTGPHLHWGVKVDGLWVDGANLLKLDFFPHLPPSVARGGNTRLGTP
ncbi:M23 family metallopeptidase [Myxococcus sp. AM009]|uniref:M23 family metallopeptidase n=1 Tax=Myxococcus sp. AM009 TaxID=2745137 RepID=UPI001595BF44|nr:M23 family metallopeptidase [Myxococcus sp. AM009]NVJ01554.1 M23 family metallopeptidase [Myxococcus sp. AM009]